MPILRPRAGISRRVFTSIAGVVVVCALLVWVVRHAGVWLVSEDALVKADAILVLSGTRVERPLEAADLHRAGWAPLVVLTTEIREPIEPALDRKGLHFPTRAELQRDLLLRMGLPASSVLIVSGQNDSTADESRAFYRLINEKRWSRVIVVTSKVHTRRAGYAIRRQVANLNVDVRVRASRYDEANPSRWWNDRATVRFVLLEWQKFLVYLLHLD